MANASYLPARERRTQILAAAKRVFARRGYHDTNISHICDALGIARGTLYQHFKSKQDVFAAIVEDLLARVREALAAVPPLEIPKRARPTREQAVAYSGQCLRAMLAVVFADEASLRILVREAVGLDVRIDRILQSLDAIVVDRYARDLAIAQRAGVVRADVDPRTAALYALGGIQKLALDALAREGKRIDLDALTRDATRMHMLGLLSDEVTR
jgi:AcrR family transcriptional regulator